MATPNRAVFKYDYADSADTPLRMLGRAVGFPALVLAIIYVPWILTQVLCAIGIVAIFVTWPKKRLSLGPRYLLCGSTVVYYANVRTMDLRPGTLELQWEPEGAFTLRSDRFPTNARKDFKIQMNKAEKFDKVSRRIIERVLHAAPAVKCRGFDRASYEVPT